MASCLADLFITINMIIHYCIHYYIIINIIFTTIIFIIIPINSYSTITDLILIIIITIVNVIYYHFQNNKTLVFVLNAFQWKCWLQIIYPIYAFFVELFVHLLFMLELTRGFWGDVLLDSYFLFAKLKKSKGDEDGDKYK